MIAKRTENSRFGSCLALEPAEREPAKSLDLSRFLWADLRKRQGSWNGSVAHFEKTVEFASELFGGQFLPKIRLALPKLLLLKMLALPKLLLLKMLLTNSAANFAGEFRRATFVSETFRRETRQNIIRLSSLLSSFGLSCLLSGPLRLRVQSRSRTRLRIAASIAFLFRACFKGV